MLIASDKNHVVLEFPTRGRFLNMKPDQARKVVEGLRESADECEQWVNAGGSNHVFRGKVYEIDRLKSWDGMVCLAFTEVHDRIELPYKVARTIADNIEAKIPEAEYNLTIEWKPNFVGV